jgi:TonB family protein
MNWFAPVGMLILKATLAWIVAGVLMLALYKLLSAAQRHFLWTLAQAAALLIPTLAVLAPPQSPRVIQTATAPVAIPQSLLERPATPRPPQRSFPVLWIWAAGAAAILAWSATGLFQIWRLTRRATPVSAGDAATLAQYLARQLNIRRSIRLVTSAHATQPFTWGVFHPVVVLPLRVWTPEQLRLVLAHELSHIRRHDWLLQMTSRLTLLVYWFHPLAWVAAFQLRKESERACDDSVLRLGADPASYAQQLLDFARTLGAHSRTYSMAVPMTHTSGFERRIDAILQTQRNRRVVGPASTGLAWFATAALIVSLASPVRIAAQSGASLLGTVTDPSGAVVPNVFVTVSNPSHKEVTLTNAPGNFQFVGLEAGTYDMEARSPGFAVFHRSGVVVAAGAPTQLSIQLSLGEVSENLTVSAQAPPSPPKPLPPGVQPKRIRVGGNVQAVKLLTRLSPEYPESARQRGVEGTVLLRAVISKEGTLLSLTTLNTLVDPDLAKAATDAVSLWHYEPTLLNGQPVEVVTTITVNFKLSQ